MKKQPGEIEQASFAIIREELRRRGLVPDDGNAAVVLRCIHASADFDYAENLRFSPGVMQHALEALKAGAVIVTDTNMARAGISRVGLQKLGGDVICLMADPSIAEVAKTRGTTRAAAAMEAAAQQFPTAIYAVGNAPTALFTLSDCMDRGFRPSLVVAAPVGFVNVVESKERILAACRRYDVPIIAAMGRKGGSSIAAAICNALIYTAADMLDPAERGWN